MADWRVATTPTRLTRICASALMMCSLIAFGCAPTRPPHSTPVVLIDGASGLENFEQIGDANWTPVDGAIQADRGSGYLVTRSSYRDVQIVAEFWASADANSGVFVRMRDRSNVRPDNSYEVNIFDARPDPAYGTGAVVGFAKITSMQKAAGRWNTLRITAQGDRLEVVLNGRKTAEVRDSSFTHGPLGLQFAGGVIRWRKFEVRSL